MKKILILANNDAGLYKFRKELLQELIEQDYEVVLSLPNGSLVNPLVELGCSFIDTPVDRRGSNPMKDFGLLRTYWKMIKKVRPDCVLTYTIKPNIYGGIICRLRKKPYIPTITGLGTAIENKGLIRKFLLTLYKISLKKASCVFFQNASNRDFFIQNKMLKTKHKLVPGSGVNVDFHNYEAYPAEQNPIRFLFIGRVMKDKGIEELMYAAAEIKKQYPDVCFSIVGGCEESYAEQLSQLDQKGILKYYGQQNDIHEFIKNHHAVVLPSYHEGMANVLLESASCGRPVLASDIPGCMETFEEGKSGIGFPPRDRQALVDRLIHFIRLPYEAKQEMGEAGRAKMESEFNRKIVIDEYLTEINLI